MKKFITVLSTVAFLGMTSSYAYAGCSTDELTEKTQKVSSLMEQVASKIGNGVDPDEFTAESGKLNEAGTALSSGDTDKACTLYDEFIAWAEKQ
ncbi:hypothetical protein WH95_00885 [Kiloniella litopenaei]|uniref:Lipoprotein n=1 Tax=Kiloniella litopenaei TaxID=1549748 RepID=A0A0M2RE17_9PROT|nr:hypothetical protein [Kiloniella litopenaei]KKJ78674.1 hypothetical protein WH95_00885 [Kiloniella litopenaei]